MPSVEVREPLETSVSDGSINSGGHRPATETVVCNESTPQTDDQADLEAALPPSDEIIDLTVDDDDAPPSIRNASPLPETTPVIKADPEEADEFDEVMLHMTLDPLNDGSVRVDLGSGPTTVDQDSGDMRAPWVVTNGPMGVAADVQGAGASLDNEIRSTDNHPGAAWQAFDHNNFDDAFEDFQARETFTQVQDAYMQKRAAGETTFEDDVEFERAKNAEKGRRRQLQDRSKGAIQTDKIADDTEDHRMFVDEDDEAEVEEEDPVQTLPPLPVSKPISFRESDRVGVIDVDDHVPEHSDCDVIAERITAATRKRRHSSKTSKSSARGSKKHTSKESKTSKKRRTNDVDDFQGPQMTNVLSLFHNDIVGDAQANHGREAQPGFASTNKRDALKELIASIPADQRKPYAADTKSLADACKIFRHHGQGSMHADGAGGWRLKGMRTSLRPHQLLGTAWMRKRENAAHAPFGGLVAG